MHQIKSMNLQITIMLQNKYFGQQLRTAGVKAWVSAHTDGSYIGMVYLDGITVARNANAYDISVVFPVKKGQTISKENGNVTCRFYSMI
ncbi:MAG: hypothetical protein ACLSFB_11365 [[Clostridium] scindens]